MRHVCPECGRTGEPGTCAADGATFAPVGSDALLGTMIGSWRVARLLGAGGMGRVYVAVHPEIGATVAIKVLKRDAAADPDVIERFFNEARAVNVIKHEAIVDVIDLGRLPDGSPYIVMEHLDGASLATVLRRDRKPALGTLARIVGEVLAALEAAHAKGVIHRDLKPDNIFISPSGRVTVLDFGIAKLLQSESAVATQTGSLLGTPAYMAPEQARSQPVDARADLYAIGVILYEATTGALPFQASNVFDLLQMHVATVPEPPRSKDPAIPAALEAVIQRALEKTPERRFSSAAEMRQALVDATADLPKLALPSSAFAAGPSATKQHSDPLAATAAASHESRAVHTTQESLARGEREPPPPPAAQPVATTVQLSRRLLFGLLGGAALLGLGGAAIAMLAMRRDTPVRVVTLDHEQAAAVRDASSPASPAPPPDPDPAPAAPDAGLVQPRAEPAVDAGSPTTPRPTPGRKPGRGSAAGSSERPEPLPTTHEPPPPPQPPTEKGPTSYKTLTIKNPSAFDPRAFFAVAEREARAMGGEVYPSNLNWGGVTRAGTIDLDDKVNTSSVVYDFVSRDAIAAGSSACIITVQISGYAGSYVSRAGLQSLDTCKTQPRLAPPACTVSQLWDKALALGMDPATERVTMVRQGARKWRVSQRVPKGDFSDIIPDDCP